jgi:mono/diheme cytochrome c family protein
VSRVLRASLIAASLLAAAGFMPQVHAEEAAPAASAPPSEPDLAKGKRVFQRNCTVCHGLRGEGGLGPPLQGIAKRLSPEDITRQLMEPRGSMPRLYPSPIDDRALVDLRAFLLQLP